MSKAMREARGILLVLGVVWLVTLSLAPLLSVLVAVLILFTLYFFRDPERQIPGDELAIVAPADGKVVEIVEVEENEFLKRPCRRIGIFLSVFDVHVNRAPIAGEVVYSEEKKGRYLDARNPASSRENAARTWAFAGDRATIVVRQITGAVARRICPWSRVGDRVAKGKRFGMIRFGSRTEIYLPLDVEILVQEGQHVRGGETVVARFPQ